MKYKCPCKLRDKTVRLSLRQKQYRIIQKALSLLTSKQIFLKSVYCHNRNTTKVYLLLIDFKELCNGLWVNNENFFHLNLCLIFKLGSYVFHLYSLYCFLSLLVILRKQKYIQHLYTECSLYMKSRGLSCLVKRRIYDCKKHFWVHPEYMVAHCFVAWIQSKVYLMVV